MSCRGSGIQGKQGTASVYALLNNAPLWPSTDRRYEAGSVGPAESYREPDLLGTAAGLGGLACRYWLP